MTCGKPPVAGSRRISLPSYLNLEGGGRMALSISPKEQGNLLVVTAFFTPATSSSPAGLDSIVLINSTADTK